MNGNTKLMPALIGGGVFGVASAIPILNLANCACCALVVAGGFLAANLYFKNLPPVTAVPYGDALVLGLLTGVICAVVQAIVSIPFTLLMGAAGGLASMEEALQNLPSEVEIPPFIEEMLMSGGAGVGFSIVGIFIGLFFSLILFSIFAPIGALLGAVMFQKKVQGA